MGYFIPHISLEMWGDDFNSQDMGLTIQSHEFDSRPDRFTIL